MNAPSTVHPESGVRQLLSEALGAISTLEFQLEQMRCLFPDDDQAIETALSDGATARAAIADFMAKPPSKQPWVRSVLDLSVEHITEGTAAALWEGERFGSLAIEDDPDPAFVVLNIPPIIDGHDATAGWPMDLQAVAKLARSLSCDFVKFDVDGDVIGDLPTRDTVFGGDPRDVGLPLGIGVDMAAIHYHGFLDWPGGPVDCEPPVLGLVDVLLRNGGIGIGKHSESLFWHHGENGAATDDIVGWRLHDVAEHTQYLRERTNC